MELIETLKHCETPCEGVVLITYDTASIHSGNGVSAENDSIGEYAIDECTIVDRCLINVPKEDADRMHKDYLGACRKHFKKVMLSSDYPEYPEYFKEPFARLYTPSENQDQDAESIFDFDGALEILEQMLDAHVSNNWHDEITIIGSASQFSYRFFEELLTIAATSSIFPVKQFAVESNDYGGSPDDHWVTIYECRGGEMQSVYCNG
jgi:hypothetical protein